MKTLSKILIALLIAISINAQADNGNEVKADANTATPSLTLSINGQVVDKVTGEALVGVAVKVNGETIYTDFDGNFQTTISNQKALHIIANLISYNTHEQVIESNKSKGLKVELNPLKK